MAQSKHKNSETRWPSPSGHTKPRWQAPATIFLIPGTRFSKITIYNAFAPRSFLDFLSFRVGFFCRPSRSISPMPLYMHYLHPTIISTLLGGPPGTRGPVLAAGMTFRAIEGVSVLHPHPDGQHYHRFTDISICRHGGLFRKSVNRKKR